MITLKEAVKIAVEQERRLYHPDGYTTLSPRIHETPDYWLFNFLKKDAAIIGYGPRIVYKADGRTHSIGSGEVPEFYKDATPVPLPA